MIDSHVHFWKFNEVRDAWITAEMSVIRRDFFPPDLLPELKKNQVEGAVAVQADQSEKETRFLINFSKQYHEIFGVIGWIDLLHPGLEQRLEKFSEEKIIKGWRHIVQAEPKGFLENPLFLENVKMLGSRNYTYGILVYHYQLPEVLDFVKKLPEQKLILNHIGKPDLKTLERVNWSKNIRKLAEHENIYCKISGLVTEAEKGKWTKEMLFSHIEVVVKSFGINRIMFGSDWPVMLLNSNYSEWLNLLKEYFQTFSKKEQRKVFHQNAVEFYNLKL